MSYALTQRHLSDKIPQKGLPDDSALIWREKMKRMEKFLKAQICLHKSFLLYGVISVFVTFIDVATCRLCERWISPVSANTVGVLTGFIIQYFLVTQHVYNKNNVKSFITFLWTFLIGLIFANSIVYAFRTYVFAENDGGMAFLISKGFSIVLPFFLMYFLRKQFMPVADDRKERN